MSRARILEISQFFLGQVVVAMVIVINSVIGGFSWMDLVWLGVLLQPIVRFNTVRLQLYSVISEI